MKGRRRRKGRLKGEGLKEGAEAVGSEGGGRGREGDDGEGGEEDGSEGEGERRKG